MRHFAEVSSSQLDPEVFSNLIRILNEHNELVKLFRTARDRLEAGEIPDFRIRLFSVVEAREYDLPTSGTLGIIVFESGPNTRTDYDVIIESRDGFPQRLHERLDSYALLFRGGRLFQQYVVGVFSCIKQNRLDFYRLRQNDIGREYLSGVYDAICRGDWEGSEINGRLILPRAFTGGPHYMYSHYLDALAICRALGNPQYFITFTCNANWSEIKRHMQQFPESTPADRADITNAVQYYRYISAELPDPDTDPQGYRVVSEMMVHGPCGLFDSDASINFRDRQPLTSILNDESKTKTTLTEWLEYNKFNEDGLHLTYIDFTKEFVWYPDSKSWRRRQRRNAVLIGRLANVHPTSGELFFLRMCAGVREMLDDDKEWHTALEDSAFSATSQQLRTLFAQILILCDVTDPLRLWKSFWRKMSDDIPITVSNSLHIKDLYMNDPELEGGVLYELEVILNSFSKTVTDFGLPLLLKKFHDVGASKLEIVGASIAESELWPHFKICRLTENMRLQQPGLTEHEKRRAAKFASWLLEIGDGKIETLDLGDLCVESFEEVDISFLSVEVVKVCLMKDMGCMLLYEGY
ncbi:DNA helicase [Tanacetum coccineum]